VTILAPGTFRVSDFRKDIPERTKRAVLKRYRFDHRPPLQDRPYDTEIGDFIPPQHDPDCIFVETAAKHDELTFGRKEGAERTATTAGSDANRRSKERGIRDRLAEFNARMSAKAGTESDQPAPQKRKRQWPSRKFSSKKRISRRS